MNIECEADVLSELESGFRFNDAVLRHLIVKREDAVTEMSAIMKNKDDKGDRRRRDDEGFGFGDDDDAPRPRRDREARPPREEAAPAASSESAE
jgi:small subunit ribosomal protein S6